MFNDPASLLCLAMPGSAPRCSALRARWTVRQGWTQLMENASPASVRFIGGRANEQPITRQSYVMHIKHHCEQ
ncbi:hypothetical protein E2C01_066914 [Portunus trituberculatus]|uniref:Uncharacterized protein n=1 Tax=Portunus trituberculatus TaxID=210409 RepID=A0A5B7HMT4_PORTR|nr:hypothetical protein [Portunus trituberculatus]